VANFWSSDTNFLTDTAFISFDREFLSKLSIAFAYFDGRCEISTPMKPIQVLLVDDDRIGRHRLRQRLEQEADFEVIGECGDGREALRFLQGHPADVLFLDINMPGMDGFELLEQLQQEPPPLVVFVTAYDEHAVRAFEACALDYLLKPFSPDRLEKTLARVRAQMVSREAELAAIRGTPESVPSASGPRFIVRGVGRFFFVDAEQIDWVEAAGNYAIFHVGKQNHMIRETMSSLESKLPADRFMRLSRSAIVNLSRIKAMESAPGGGDVVVLCDDQRVQTTRSVKEIAERLDAMPAKWP
jgi:two-component system LytT family response regulator